MNLVFSLLTPDMDRRGFACGEAGLDAYLQKQAGQDMRRGFATVIAARESSRPEKVIGFYSLAAASVLLDALPEATVRKMPRYPSVPAIRLGRLAVIQKMQGRHVGSLLVWDAMRRCCRNELAWAVMLVDAKSDRLAAFYEKFLFRRFSDRDCSLWISRRQVEHMLAR
ncbi:MAG: GNAT family N-acetyltransferase [Desulfovibrio sp.]|nr:GNAT family N-acetyltransferase [Desulfovibrio sp.]